MRLAGSACVLMAGWFAPLVLGAQSLDLAREGIAPPVAASSAAHEREPSALVATVASAVIPGAGQALLGSRRAIFYGVAEVTGWAVYSVQLHQGDRQRSRYRDLSRNVARAQFVPNGPAGTWDYYERMEKFVASGAYDVIPGGVVDPNPDPSTYNGSMWLLARQTYWRDPTVSPGLASPEYELALSFYERRAVHPDLQWSWAGSPEGFQQYRQSIAASNAAFKRAEQTVGLIIANHILSVVDAYVSVRLRRDTGGRTTLTAGIPLGGTR